MTAAETVWTIPAPLPVRWDRTVLHPDPLVPEDPTIIGCLTETGHGVALVLDPELREALGLALLAPEGDAAVDPQQIEQAQARDAALAEVDEALTRFLGGMSEDNPRRQGMAFAIGVVAGLRMTDTPPSDEEATDGRS